MVQEQTFSQESITNTDSRIRDLEGKYNLIRDRVLIINNNMLEEYKRLMSELKLVNEEITKIKTDIFSIKENMKHIIQDFEQFAKKDDVKYLEKYINLWNPMKFVTESDVLKILEEHKEEKKKDAKHR